MKLCFLRSITFIALVERILCNNNQLLQQTIISKVNRAQIEQNPILSNITHLSNVLSSRNIVIIFDKTISKYEDKIYKAFSFHSKLRYFRINDALNEEGFVTKFFSDINIKNEQAVILIGEISFIKETMLVASTMDLVLDQHEYFTYLYKWVLISNAECDTYLDILDSFYNVLCVNMGLSKEHINLFDYIIRMKTLVFEDTRPSFQNVTLANYDKPYANTALTYQLLFPNLSSKLNMKKYLIGSQIWEPYELNRNFNNVTNDTTYSGIYFEVITEIANYLNMTFEIVIPEDGAWAALILMEHGMDL